jgi:hypothetical protein
MSRIHNTAFWYQFRLSQHLNKKQFCILKIEFNDPALQGRMVNIFKRVPELFIFVF